MKVLSLFDGISCSRVALEKAGIPVEAYYASEIDKYAIEVSAKNWPEIIQIGGVEKVEGDDGFTNTIDLLIGGSPCQDLSIAKKDRKGLDGERSGLFWEYVRILKEIKPKYFILENVASMPKEAKQLITETLGVEPIMIDAQLVSAQRRKRLFWTNINVCQPEDRGIFLKDILEDIPTPPDHLEIKPKSKTQRLGGKGSKIGDKHEWDSVYQFRRTYWRETKGGKVPTLTANMGTGGNNVPYVVMKPRGKNSGNSKKDGKSPTLTSSSFEHNAKLVNGNEVRRLTVTECERLQSLPDGYTEGISITQRYKALGNAFNADVITHILKHIPCVK